MVCGRFSVVIGCCIRFLLLFKLVIVVNLDVGLMVEFIFFEVKVIIIRVCLIGKIIVYFLLDVY